MHDMLLAVPGTLVELAIQGEHRVDPGNAYVFSGQMVSVELLGHA
jgi:hypothetical protein